MEKTIEIAAVRDRLNKFIKNRGFDKYRTPKNLAMALAVESAELMEIFQWMTPEESIKAMGDEDQGKHICEELADIFSYLVQLATVLQVDLEQCFWEKMKKNEEKYPE